MIFTRTLGACTAGLLLVIYPGWAHGTECGVECPHGETCMPVNIPDNNTTQVVPPTHICAKACDSCPAECCNDRLQICEVPGRAPNGICSNDCGCYDPQICCPETMTCGTPVESACSVDSDCCSDCCASQKSPPVCVVSGGNDGDPCFTMDSCDCTAPLKCLDGTCKRETCGDWEGECVDKKPVSLPDSTDCGGSCDEHLCCRSETCGEWEGECVDPKPVFLPDSKVCGGSCDEHLCCRSETCGEWQGECEDPTPYRKSDDVDCCASCGDCESTCCSECNNDDQCEGGEICCPEDHTCGTPGIIDPTACGDPHMTGFLGQKFDFTGEDGAWYALIADVNMNINMRVTSTVVGLPEITYITGLSVLIPDADGFDHTIVIEVKDPHNLDSSCPVGVSPCLADGSLRVTLDGEETLLTPGTVSLGQGVQILAANLPGACRSFGFEKYWERKQLENHGRRLGKALSMGEWILGDPTATNMEECVKYVARTEVEDDGLFAHQSEHASFQIVTPKATIRLSHGRLHQIAMRDPTDQFDLPDHLTWQMNVAVDHSEVSRDARGVLGETVVPTRDANGEPIMTGMEAIRGKQEDYRVEGALGTDFVQDAHTS